MVNEGLGTAHLPWTHIEDEETHTNSNTTKNLTFETTKSRLINIWSTELNLQTLHSLTGQTTLYTYEASIEDETSLMHIYWISPFPAQNRPNLNKKIDMLVMRTRLTLRDEMKCNAQPCESCWLVADLKLLCPHSLRSSPVSLSSSPLSPWLQRLCSREDPPLQRHSVAHRRCSSIGRLCALQTTVLLPRPSISSSDGLPRSVSRSDFGCIRSSGFHLCMRCAPSCRVPSSSMWWSLSHPTVGCVYSSSIWISSAPFLEQLNCAREWMINWTERGHQDLPTKRNPSAKLNDVITSYTDYPI